MSSGSSTAMALVTHRDPALSAGRKPETRGELLGSVTSLAALVLALVLGSVFPEAINFAALLLLLSGPVETLVERRWAKHPQRPAADVT